MLCAWPAQMQQSAMGFGSVPNMGMGGRSMSGLGSGGIPGNGSGLNLGAGASLQSGLNSGGLRNNTFGAMQGAPTSYNPSSEILSMINQGQNNLGLSNQPLISSSLPPALSQPGMPPGQPGLGLGMPSAGACGLPEKAFLWPSLSPTHPSSLTNRPTSDSRRSALLPRAGSGANPNAFRPMGNNSFNCMPSAVSSPSFDLSDFPTLGQQGGGACAAASMQSFRSSQGLNVPPPPPQSEFAIQSEDFPALPGAAPASSECATNAIVSSVGGVGVGIFRGGGVEAVLGLGKEGEGLPTAAGESLGLGGRVGGRTDRYGLMGLLSVIRMTDQDLNTLALGTDLTTLGLNLNSSECLYATFASPWADSPAQRDPEFSLPQCYYMQPPALKTGHFSKFQLETLFYIFYNMPRRIPKTPKLWPSRPSPLYTSPRTSTPLSPLPPLPSPLLLYVVRRALPSTRLLIIADGRRHSPGLCGDGVVQPRLALPQRSEALVHKGSASGDGRHAKGAVYLF